MYTTLIVQPIFNVLTFIYALIPGHNFGLAIIVFTLIARFTLYPLLKKQLKHTKAMRDLQPEIKKIKASAKGNRQQESLLTMELYKEREVKPMAYLGLMVLQLVIFLALFQGLNRVVNDPQQLYDFSYPIVQNTSTMQDLNQDISKFDNTLFGTADLGRSAIDSTEGFYFPAFLLVLGSSVIQYFQIKQTMPSGKQSRKLREILSDANGGKQADSSEVNAAMGRNMGYILPIVIFVITIGFAAALSLYWFVGGLIAYLQQRHLLKQDEYAMLEPTAEVVSKKPLKKEEELLRETKKTVKGRKDAPVKVTRVTQETKQQQPAAPKKKARKNRKKRR